MDFQDALKQLVLSLDDEHGMNEQGYLAMRHLIAKIWGADSVVELDKFIKTIEGRFYFDDSAHALDCLHAIEEKSKGHPKWTIL